MTEGSRPPGYIGEGIGCHEVSIPPQQVIMELTRSHDNSRCTYSIVPPAEGYTSHTSATGQEGLVGKFGIPNGRDEVVEPRIPLSPSSQQSGEGRHNVRTRGSVVSAYITPSQARTSLCRDVITNLELAGVSGACPAHSVSAWTNLRPDSISVQNSYQNEHSAHRQAYCCNATY